MTLQEAIKYLKETRYGCSFIRDRQLFDVCNISISAIEKQIAEKAQTIPNNKDTLKNAIKIYGPMAQTVKAIEELSELQQALSRIVITDLTGIKFTPEQINIDEEMADVEIMLEQLKMILCNDKKVAEWKTKEIVRLAERLNTN